MTPFELGAGEEGEAVEEEVGVEEPAVAAVGACGCSCCWSVAAVVETVAFAEGAEAVAVGPVEETEAGEACAGVVAGSVFGAGLIGAVGVGRAVAAAVDGAAVGAGSEAVVGDDGGTEAEAVVGEEESKLGDPLNAGCDAGDCGKHVAGWPLWMPPFSSARKRQGVSLVKAMK